MGQQKNNDHDSLNCICQLFVDCMNSCQNDGFTEQLSSGDDEDSEVEFDDDGEAQARVLGKDDESSYEHNYFCDEDG